MAQFVAGELTAATAAPPEQRTKPRELCLQRSPPPAPVLSVALVRGDNGLATLVVGRIGKRQIRAALDTPISSSSAAENTRPTTLFRPAFLAR
jgi:D-alanyl-D-alanine carboxypeptidase